MITSEDLNKIRIFACLDEADRHRFASKAAELYLQPGDMLIREGETPYFYVLLEGTMQLSKEIQGRSMDLNQYEAGEFFGEVPIMLGVSHMASLRAAKFSRVARFERQQFQELIRTSETCSGIILQTMNDRLQRVQRYTLEMSSSRVLVVGSQYDVDCREIRTFLSMNRISYEWVDRERDPERVPNCMPTDLSGPAVVVDRTFCVGQPPTVRKVAEALGIRTMPRKEDYDVLVVGGGPAGLAAAVYGASEGLSVLLIERAAAGGQAGTSSRIENYLGFPSGISGDDLSERALRQAERFGAEMVLTRDVENIEPMNTGYCVELDGGDRVRSKTVVIATGVAWRRLEAENIDRLLGRGVLYGAARTEAPTVIGKDVFIVGGGNSAGQAAMYFSSYANSVTILVRGEGLHLTMSQYLIAQLKSRRNIKIEPYTKVVSVVGDDHLETICTTTNDAEPRTRKADALFVMIGADASTDWLPRQLQRDERGYICTGRDISDLPDWSGKRVPFLLETNMPGLFCAGDVRHNSIKRVSSGVGEGSMAIAFIHQYLALNPVGTEQALA
ncbi:MAG TPA: FAD-dependent oxidoreductase [Acidobacteriaceae bacterium]|jgi:thioredoxin reductase (NADPH)